MSDQKDISRYQGFCTTKVTTAEELEDLCVNSAKYRAKVVNITFGSDLNVRVVHALLTEIYTRDTRIYINNDLDNPYSIGNGAISMITAEGQYPVKYEGVYGPCFGTNYINVTHIKLERY